MLRKLNVCDGIEKSPCVFLLGGFDGLHIGHKKLVDFAKFFRLPVGMMTMEGGKGKGLFTLEEKCKIFYAQGVDFIDAMSFDERLKNTLRTDFINVLLKRYSIRAFVCGKDFRFGKDAAGDPAFIANFTGLPVYDLDILNVDGQKVSSTLIKERLKEGKVKEANALLVQPFFVSGKVEEGRKEGRQLSFPTANLAYPDNKFLIKEGVYAVHSELNKKRYNGICNVGACPTFGVDSLKVEVNYDGFEGDLYGQPIDVFFDGYLRDIQKFPSKEGLIEQLNFDRERVKNGNY
jgi:riboflavin kinase/FMN adenylyltransferase